MDSRAAGRGFSANPGVGTTLYERHLGFDQLIPAHAATRRDQYEAVARSIRQLLTEQWIRTDQTYLECNPKQVYYVSLEFLMGRALATNIASLRLESQW